ncbi:MAG: phosphoribosylglycinamide formyltransferase [Oscillospiraceae bacterium]
MLNIVVLVSGGGTNLQALIDAQNNNTIKNGKIVCVIASNDKAYALTRARENGIDTVVVPRKEFDCSQDFDAAIMKQLDEKKADLVVLAGFMSILGKAVTDKYSYKIINIHPALIPSFSGPGCYGLHVHEKALECGVKITGATVHFVSEKADAGAIIMQKAVEVCSTDTPQTLQTRVMKQAEWEILPKAVELFCSGRIFIKNDKAYILEE